MTTKEFRSIALSLPETSEHSHQLHPDFRVGGKIFASLGYPDRGWGMVKLRVKDQRPFMAEAPGRCIPAPGKWGKSGATTIHLSGVSKTLARRALVSAWRNVAPAQLSNRIAVE